MENTETDGCPKCGAEVPKPAGPGRPATYCSSARRRAAEFELRRAQRRLESAEVDHETKRRLVESIDAGMAWASDKTAARARLELGQAQRLVVELEARMRLLLSGGADVQTS